MNNNIIIKSYKKIYKYYKNIDINILTKNN